ERVASAMIKSAAGAPKLGPWANLGPPSQACAAARALVSCWGLRLPSLDMALGCSFAALDERRPIMRRIKFIALTAVIPLLSSGSVDAQSQLYNWVTIAGYPGYGSVDGTDSAARFHYPTSAAQDSAGNIYVTDTSNST